MLKIVNLEKIIRSGLAHFQIDYGQRDVKDLLFLVDELCRWNEKVNLTGTRDPERIAGELLCDAFFLAGYVGTDKSVLDLGSGSGMPAIPLAILKRHLRVCSIDKSLRKIQFQRHIKRGLSLGCFEPIHGRAEEVPSLTVDSLVAKAFGTPEAILKTGGKHIGPAGRALMLRGTNEEEPPLRCGEFSLSEALPYRLPGVDKSYKLLIYKKVS